MSNSSVGCSPFRLLNNLSQTPSDSNPVRAEDRYFLLAQDISKDCTNRPIRPLYDYLSAV